MTDLGDDPSAEGRPPAPVTGEDAVDRALAGLSDLDSAPVSEHHDRLARAHEALHQALHRDEDAAQPR